MADFHAIAEIIAEVATVRERAALDAVQSELIPRCVMTGQYNMGEVGNTDDGCQVYPALPRWGAPLHEAIEIHFPTDAPREEVCALLRHMAEALETDQLPRRSDAPDEAITTEPEE